MNSTRWLLLALLTMPAPSRAQSRDLDLLESLGISESDGAWLHRATADAPARGLSSGERDAVLGFLAALPKEGRDKALAAPLQAACKQLAEDCAGYLEPGGLLTPQGRRRVVPALLATGPASAGRAPEADRQAVTAQASERVGALASALAAPDFDGGGIKEGRPLDLTLRWGSAPRAGVHHRNLETLYGLYGHGSDALLEKTGVDGIIARAAKVPADGFLAWAATLAGHELGHFERAWLAGANGVSWAPAPGPNAFGRITEVREKDWLKMTPAQRQAFNAGGIEATQAATAELRWGLVERGEADWTRWPLLLAQKLDMTIYGLTAPKPSVAGRLDSANDVTSYARAYGERSGRGGDEVHSDIVRGAVWNMLDPLALFAAYGYIKRYVIDGDRLQETPALEFGGRAWLAGTGFWLSETGPRYSLSVLSRGRDGDLWEVTPTMGEGQAAIAARYSDELGRGWRGRLGGDLWNQRAAAEAGPNEFGGALKVGVEKRLGGASLHAEVGRKTGGAMLGQPQGGATFWTVGISGRF